MDTTLNIVDHQNMQNNHIYKMELERQLQKRYKPINIFW